MLFRHLRTWPAFCAFANLFIRTHNATSKTIFGFGILALIRYRNTQDTWSICLTHNLALSSNHLPGQFTNKTLTNTCKSFTIQQRSFIATFIAPTRTIRTIITATHTHLFIFTKNFIMNNSINCCAASTKTIITQAFLILRQFPVR